MQFFLKKNVKNINSVTSTQVKLKLVLSKISLLYDKKNREEV